MSGEATLPNVTESPLTKREEDAARLVAEDDLTDEQIAVSVGVAKMTLERWKKRLDFAARVTQHKEGFKDAALAEGFADKRLRVRALNTLASGLLTQLSDAEYHVLLRMTENGMAIYGFDGGRVREFRGCLDDLAKEMGDRRAGMDVKHTIDRRREAEAIAAEIGKGDDPAIVGQIERDLLLSVSPTR